MDLPRPLKIAGPMAFAPFCFPLGRPDHSCFMPIFEFISLKFSWDCKYKGKWVFTGHMAARTIAILQKSLIFRHISYDWLEDDNQGNSTEVFGLLFMRKHYSILLFLIQGLDYGFIFVFHSVKFLLFSASVLSSWNIHSIEFYVCSSAFFKPLIPSICITITLRSLNIGLMGIKG